jgi:hypothetical protein
LKKTRSSRASSRFRIQIRSISSSDKRCIA